MNLEMTTKAKSGAASFQHLQFLFFFLAAAAFAVYSACALAPAEPTLAFICFSFSYLTLNYSISTISS